MVSNSIPKYKFVYFWNKKLQFAYLKKQFWMEKAKFDKRMCIFNVFLIYGIFTSRKCWRETWCNVGAYILNLKCPFTELFSQNAFIFFWAQLQKFWKGEKVTHFLCEWAPLYDVRCNNIPFRFLPLAYCQNERVFVCRKLVSLGGHFYTISYFWLAIWMERRSLENYS